jgi:hypothetical protein
MISDLPAKGRPLPVLRVKAERRFPAFNTFTGNVTPESYQAQR